MFRGRRAWFSQSVGPGPRELWAAGGGTLAHWRDAELLFSSDAAHPDTLRIHESRDYLEGRATVFHSQFLSAWASAGVEAKLSVVLGHFVLPPACLQEEIRRKIGRFIWERAEDSLAEEVKARNSYYSGCSLIKHRSDEETGCTVPAQGEPLYRALQEYPMSNMVTGYASARDMKKYMGELCDFIPGTSGYAAYWVGDEITLRGHAKTRTKGKR
ncbi:TERB2 protein, partial [Bucorvus abyssinicus]|nr:TERB2 protein [Bucorvus abyssinicus]